jgi:uncharacterized membrane protein
VKSQDESLELLIGRLLRIGILTSSIGLALGLAVVGFAPVPGGWLLHAGVMILIMTPAARVILSIAEYVAARDWTFAALSTIVLIELLAGAVAALVFHRRI